MEAKNIFDIGFKLAVVGLLGYLALLVNHLEYNTRGRQEVVVEGGKIHAYIDNDENNRLFVDAEVSPKHSCVSGTNICSYAELPVTVKNSIGLNRPIPVEVTNLR